MVRVLHKEMPSNLQTQLPFDGYLTCYARVAGSISGQQKLAIQYLKFTVEREILYALPLRRGKRWLLWKIQEGGYCTCRNGIFQDFFSGISERDSQQRIQSHNETDWTEWPGTVVVSCGGVFRYVWQVGLEVRIRKCHIYRKRGLGKIKREDLLFFIGFLNSRNPTKVFQV